MIRYICISIGKTVQKTRTTLFCHVIFFSVRITIATNDDVQKHPMTHFRDVIKYTNLNSTRQQNHNFLSHFPFGIRLRFDFILSKSNLNGEYKDKVYGNDDGIATRQCEFLLCLLLLLLAGARPGKWISSYDRTLAHTHTQMLMLIVVQQHFIVFMCHFIDIFIHFISFH